MYKWVRENAEICGEEDKINQQPDEATQSTLVLRFWTISRKVCTSPKRGAKKRENIKTSRSPGFNFPNPMEENYVHRKKETRG
jgi:hypothetical protein